MTKWVALPLTALLITNCGSTPGTEASKKLSLEGDIKGVVPDVGTIIIDLPASIAPADSSLRLADDDLKNVFLLPVTFTGIGGQMTKLTKSVVEHIFGKAVCLDDDDTNDEADCRQYMGIISGQISETATVFEVPGDKADSGSPSHVKYWANPAGSDYDIGLELYWPNSAGKYVPALQMQLSKTGEQQGKGEFKFFPNYKGTSKGPNVILSTFSATEAKRSMDLQIYFKATDGLASLGLSVTDTDGLITGAGTALRPALTADKGAFAPFETKEEFAYVYTLAADSVNDIAVEKMAAVTATQYAEESTYFSNYGVDGLLKDFTLNLLRNSSSSFNCATSGKYLSSALPVDICKTNTAVTDADVIAGLTTFCTNNPSNSTICPIAGQLSRWANPIYLDSNGYVGNENYQKPTSVTYAPLVEALSGVSILTPTAFKAMTQPPVPDAVDVVK